MPKTVWITGGHGFVGRRLTERLAARGAEVWVLERQFGEVEPEDHVLRIALNDPEAVGEALARTRPRAIVHLAAQSSGALSHQLPRETLRNNLESTLGLLQAILAHDADSRPRLLSIGSCEEYGPPRGDDELPLTEEQTLRPSNPYAVSKAAQTLLCQQYRRAHGLDVLCARSFTHSGPGQADHFVFSSWAKQIAELEVRGGGELLVGNLEVSRDVSHVDDVTRAYADLLEVPWDEDAVNVCRGVEVPLRSALDHLCSRARAEIGWRVDPARLRPGDVPRFVGDPSRLRSMIGWVPSTPIETTLDELLEWWRRQVGAPTSTPGDTP